MNRLHCWLPALALVIPSPLPGQAPKPSELDFRDGVASIPDRATFVRLAHKGNAGRDTYLNGIEFVKFVLVGAGSKEPLLYWMNTRNQRAHPMFMRNLGIGGGFGRGRGGFGRRRQDDDRIPESGITMRGAVSYRPRVRAPDGTAGVYVYDFQPNDAFSFELLKCCYDILIEKAPFLAGKLAYHPLQGGLERYERDKALFEKGKLPVYLDDVLDREIAFLPMNTGRSFGRLRRMTLEELPSARDIVLYESPPNELPRVAGMITAVRQTPLSHVNLRAIQDRVPNAFVAGAGADARIRALLGRYVCYTVRPDGWDLRPATREEVDAHMAALRPATPQVPRLDLSVEQVLPLDAIGFGDAAAFGAKTANVAELRKLGLPAGMVPDGFGVPFSFYREFLRHNGIDAKIAGFVQNETLRRNAESRKAALRDLRRSIRRGAMPGRMREAFGRLQRSFPEGTHIRCRSSTNNEDLPGFSGAGLYDSLTHKPDEGHLEKTIKQVWASLWRTNAFDEREFYRVDHEKTAMGVLVHPSFRGERANGVAVTLDVLYEREGYNYVNAQVGEDMVTNPKSRSIPEEVLLPWRRGEPRWMQSSNRVPDGRRVLSLEHLDALARALETIHREFAKLHGKRPSDPKFAMEVELKVTKDDRLAIKQTRPWIFGAPAGDR